MSVPKSTLFGIVVAVILQVGSFPTLQPTVSQVLGDNNVLNRFWHTTTMGQKHCNGCMDPALRLPGNIPLG